MNYLKAYQFAIDLLTHELPDYLAYHNVQHTINVVRDAELLGTREGVSDKELLLLKTAAAYHDTGFIKEYFRNEPLGAHIAEENLPQFGYTDEDIKVVKNLILSTAFPPEPNNLLQSIICDADLFYVGQKDFKTIADGLKKEFYHVNLISSEKEWLKLQVAFLKNMRYHTRTALELNEHEYCLNLRKAEKDYAEYEKTLPPTE